MDYNIHSLTIDEKIKLAEELWKSIEMSAYPYLLLNNNSWING